LRIYRAAGAISYVAHMVNSSPPKLRVERGPLAGLSLWQVLVVLALSTLVVLAGRAFFEFTTSTTTLLLRAAITSLTVLLAFTLVSNIRWRWLPRHAARFIAIPLISPLALLGAYGLTLPFGFDFWHWSEAAWVGWTIMSVLSVIVGLAAALVYIYLERDREANEQALRFALERETLERLALTARMRLMQAQIEPHFLFNTLANVQQLVESGSAAAAPLLKNLIAYLRLAIPQTRSEHSTLAAEFELARNYLAIMQMRMPDRLQFKLHLPVSLQRQAVPPMAVLTLVENAVKHGIDPTEHGGEVSVSAKEDSGIVAIDVRDTGAGLHGLLVESVGLSNLRERLATLGGPEATFALTSHQGATVAAIRLPFYPLPT
jgi:signal transduction histidine kinase